MAEILLKVSYRIIDLAITILSFILGYFLADFLTGYSITIFGFEITFGGLRSLPEFLLILFVIPFIWWVTLNRVSVYNPLIIRKSKMLLWALVKAHVGGGILLFGLFFLAKLYFPSRSQLFFFLSINVLLLFIEKRVMVFFWKVKKQETSFQRILLIGMDPESRRFARHINNYPELGYKIVGCLTHRFDELDESLEHQKILGNINQIEMVVRENPIDEVIIFSSRRIWDTMDMIAGVCEDMGIRLTIVPQWPTLKISHITFRKLGGTPMLSFVSNPAESRYVFIKRVMDFFLALMVLIFLSPLLILVALLIKWDSKGPVFFIQKRCGLNGREFSLIKFRSMVNEAEKMQENLKNLNEMSGPVFKITQDPRVTRVGAWLRKTSLDELPQLFNVLKGDISLVGPRPPLPSEVALYERWQRRRLSVKPGITCIWQISGRNNINFDEWMKLDLNYIDHWSIALDMKILIRTIPAVLSGRGAR
jgi:exopolysaccharide biosynthesis polyprenyl glycosylphosphotransferase